MFLGGFIEFQTAQDLRQSSNSGKVSQIGILLKISAIGIEVIDA